MYAKWSILLLSLSLLVSGCGNDVAFGGSAGTRLNEIDYGIKQLRFSWASVPDADTYRLLENPDGISGYSQIAGDFPATITSYDYDIAVHLQDWSNASYILQSCTGIDCTNSSAQTATDSRAAMGYLKASNTNINDSFGSAVAVSGDGNTVAVGAWAEDSDPLFGAEDNSFTNSGAVYVYTRGTDGWEGPIYLKADNAESGDRFGYSVSLSGDGDTLAVGATGEAGVLNSVPGAGAVYIFTRDNAGVWSQAAYLKVAHPDGPGAVSLGDNFGTSVSLSDNGFTLAIGAPGEDGNGVNGETNNANTDSGAVYVFTRNNAEGSDWTQQAYLKAGTSDPDQVKAFSEFGRSLSLSGDGKVLATGAWLEDDGTEVESGAVYVFSFGATWDTGIRLRAANLQNNDRFGVSVALSPDGSTLAAGAYLEDGLDNAMQNDSGAAYVFVNNGGWSEQAYIKPEVVDAGDQFGISMSLGGAGGDILVVGANLEDGAALGVGGDPQLNTVNASGAGYVFLRDAGEWSPHAYLKSSNTDLGDRFGSAMAISANGRTLAVGAPDEDSTATGIGGDQSNNNAGNAGAVYLY